MVVPDVHNAKALGVCALVGSKPREEVPCCRKTTDRARISVPIPSATFEVFANAIMGTLSRRSPILGRGIHGKNYFLESSNAGLFFGVTRSLWDVQSNGINFARRGCQPSWHCI